MIKIMHVVTDMQFGGAGRWLINLVSEMNYDRFQITIVIPTGSILNKFLKEYPVTVIEIDGIANKSYSRKGVKNLKKLMNEIEPDIVHTHACLSARKAARIQGRHIVFTKHCMEETKSNGLILFFKRIMNGFYTSRVIAVSEAVAKSMQKVFPNRIPIDTVYGGIHPLNKISGEEKLILRRELCIDDKEIVVGIVGRLSPVKRHEDFIEMAELVCQIKNNVKFLIVGGGPNDAMLKDLVATKHNLEGKIIFTGYIENVEALVNIIDINVVTSQNEALCLSAIEAMSIGIPTIATNVGGLPEVIEDGVNGILTPVALPAQMAVKIVNLINDSNKRNRLAQEAIATVKNKFNIEKMVNAIEEIYTDMNTKRHKVILDKHGKLFGKLNIIDLVAIVLILCIGFFGYTRFIAKPETVANQTISYKVEIQNCPKSIKDMLIEGGTVRESVKGNKLGKLKSFVAMDAKAVTPNVEDGTYALTIIPDRYDVILELEAPYAEKGGNILIDGMPIKTGAKIFIQGKGYAGIGYIIAVPRID